MTILGGQDQAEPAQSPVNVRATVLGPFTVRLDWDHPKDSGRPPRKSYNIIFSSLINRILPPDSTSKVITNLAPGTTIRGTMHATNDEWPGEPPTWANPAVFTAAEWGPVTTEPNTLPTSADFALYTATNTALVIDKADFPYTDPDVGRHDEEGLHVVKIITLPDAAHGKLVRRVSGLRDKDLSADSTIRFNHGETLAFRPGNGLLRLCRPSPSR